MWYVCGGGWARLEKELEGEKGEVSRLKGRKDEVVN